MAFSVFDIWMAAASGVTTYIENIDAGFINKEAFK